MSPGGVLDFNLQILTGMLTLLGFIAIFFTLRNRSEEAELRRLLDNLQTRLPSPEQQLSKSAYFKNWVDDRESALGLLNEFMDTIRENVRQAEVSFRGYAQKYQELIEEASYINKAIKMCKYLLRFSAIIAITSFAIAISGNEDWKVVSGTLLTLALLLFVLYWIHSHLDSLFRLADKYPSPDKLLDMEYTENKGIINTSLLYNTVGIYLKLMHDVEDKGPRKGFVISVLLPVPYYNFTITPVISYKIGDDSRRYGLQKRYVVPFDTTTVSYLKGTNERTDVLVEFFHVVEDLQDLDVKEMLAHLKELYISVRFEMDIASENKYTEFVISRKFMDHIAHPEVHPNIYRGTFVLFNTVRSISENETKKMFDRDTIEIDKRQ